MSTLNNVGQRKELYCKIRILPFSLYITHNNNNLCKYKHYTNLLQNVHVNVMLFHEINKLIIHTKQRKCVHSNIKVIKMNPITTSLNAKIHKIIVDKIKCNHSLNQNKSVNILNSFIIFVK